MIQGSQSMHSLHGFLEKINVTQRHAVLAVLLLYFLGAILLAVFAAITPIPPMPDVLYVAGTLSGAILFGGAWLLYYKHNWESARYFAAITSSLLVGLLLPEPFVSQYAPMVIVIPTILALVLTEPFFVLVSGGLTFAILLARAHGTGVYAQPATLIIYLMILGGLLLRRLIGETSLRQLQEAQDKTRQNERRFRSLIENSIDEVSILSADGKLIYESPSARPTLGYGHGEFLGRDLFQLIHADDVDRVRKILSDVVQDPSLHPREQFRLLHKNGTWRWVEGVGTNLIDEPSIQGVVINYHDVTERVEADELILRQLKRLHGLRLIDIAISSSLNLNITLDVVLQQNIQLLGVDAAAVLLINPASQAVEYAASRGFRQNASPYIDLHVGRNHANQALLERKIIHIPHVMENGGLATVLNAVDEAYIDYYGAPLIAKGEVKGVLEVYRRSTVEADREWLDFLQTLAGQTAIAIDNAQLFNSLQSANAELERRVIERTAELNRSNAELERANRTKDEFLATMSHELRTPLNSILGLSEALLEQRRDRLTERQEKSLELIESSGRHLLELINDILDLSKIEAGMFDFYPQPVAIDEFCRSCLSFVKAQAIKKSITLTYISEPFVTKIFADPRRLKQILVNLLTNAVKFTYEHGNVTLRVTADVEQDSIQFSVIDNGIGIAPEDLQRLFQPFVQVDSSLSRQYEGTGLGLSLVQKLTDLHGGSVAVESAAGKGSQFTIRIPCKLQELAQLENHSMNTAVITSEPTEIARAALDQAMPGPTILLAEDNMANILTIAEYLESHGYRLATAHDGLEAIEKAQSIRPDVILMDIQMPAVNGLDAIARLRAQEHFATTPIIALTALAMPGDRERCLRAGANEYMSKPVSLKRMLQNIEMLLHGQPAL